MRISKSRLSRGGWPRYSRRHSSRSCWAVNPFRAAIRGDSSLCLVGCAASVVAASRAGNRVRFRAVFMVTSSAFAPSGRFHRLKPGQSRADGNGQRGLNSPVRFACTLFVGGKSSRKLPVRCGPKAVPVTAFCASCGKSRRQFNSDLFQSLIMLCIANRLRNANHFLDWQAFMA